MVYRSFIGGIHPKDYKSYTENKTIRQMPTSSNVVIPLSQHVGSVSTPIVAVGDVVKTGQKIAEASGRISLNMHSTISGTVKAIDNFLHPRGDLVLSIEIEGDGKDEWIDLVDENNFLDLHAEEMKNRIFDAGICGMGGAGFPSVVKLEPPKDKPIDTVIISGVECEPYLTADHRMMIERPEDILNGLKICMKILGAEKGIIGIESNKPAAIKIMKNMVKKEKNINVVVLKFKYPQGGEKQLVYAATKRVVPQGGLPSAVGVLVNNVATATCIYEAVRFKKPLVEKIITISGQIVNKPSNLMVRIGTKLSEIISYCGETKEPIGKAIIGGPMMGYTTCSLESPIIKTVSGVILLNESESKSAEEQNCLRCGKCVDVCPNKLMPCFMASCVKHNDIEGAKKAGLEGCMKCGCCAFVCPAHIKFIQWVDVGKMITKNAIK